MSGFFAREPRRLEAFTKHAVHHIEFIAVVEAKLELVKIQRQILRGDFMKDAHNAALEQGLDVLTAVGMNRLSVFPVPHIGLTMIDGFVGKLRRVDLKVGAEFIRMNLGAFARIKPDEVLENRC